MASLAQPSGRPAEQRRSGQFDPWLIVSTLFLMIVGFMSLYSEGTTRDGDADFRKQAMFAVIGLGPFLIFAMVHPKVWQRIGSLLYGVNLLGLGAIFVIGSRKNGADRWIELGPLQFQPSEMAKLLTIITLAAFFANRQDSIRSAGTYFLSFLHVLPPLALILLQPHLGAAMVIMVSWFAISWVAGVQLKHIGIAAGIVLALGIGVLTVPAISAKVLNGYQQDRISGLSGSDSQGKNWQTDRAKIAFGTGGVSGVGYLKGEQKAEHYIPEQHTDFVLTVLGEEGGLVGCTMVLAAFGFFFYRIWLVMFHATELYYKMLAAGVFAALFFHMVVNMSMVLQLVPVVGLWLPFLSYGGTALWLCMACVGLVLNVRRKEKRILF